MTMTKARAAQRPSNVPPMTHLESAAAMPDAFVGTLLFREDDWCVFADSSLQPWEVFIDPIFQRTFVSQDTWNTIAWHQPAEDLFVTSYVNVPEVTGMRFIVSDAGPYAEAARKEAVAAGTNVPAQKDRLQQLAEKATGLVMQAASLNASATEGQTQTFMVRQVKLQHELARLEAELAQARSLVELAATAVFDATT